ncbi:hypothetical protein FACS1894106_2390 [Spirochaetia bacterium]|nr:hypothetical protein FACS1894106_2390 [Spirochaetia bacterium]
MKRLLILLVVPLLLFSCKSSGKRTISMNPNFLADLDPIAIGSAAMQFDKLVSSSLEKREVDVWFNPRTDSVYLQFRYQTINFRQIWDKSNRLQFVTALENYKKDYEAKNLNLKSSRARRAYGTLTGSIEWGQFSSAYLMNAEARPYIQMGYQFRQNSPYFTVYQEAAESLTNLGDDVKKTSLGITTYFTRAQAEELAKLFDQQYLLSFIGRRADPGAAIPVQEDDYDGYTEAGE